MTPHGKILIPLAGGVLMAPHGKILIPLTGGVLMTTSFHPGTKTKTPMMVLTGVFKISF